MSLAMILGVCSLVVSTPSVWPVVQAPLISQATSSQQNPSTSDSQQNPVQPVEQKTEPPTSAEKAPAKPTTDLKATPKKRPRRKTPVAPPTSDGPTKVIVKNGGAPDPSVQLSPGVSADQASHQRQSTGLLLSTTESNLKAAEGRQLNANQQDMVNQIREYIKQAKTSADTGDLHRAHNLAFKAKLLSDELAKH